MWFGITDGLNRFDGFDFKIYKAQPGKNNVLSNSRIIKIREDGKDFLWVQTYDGYYHYLNKTKDQFSTFPFYSRSEEEKNSVRNCFHQPNPDEIWLGSSNSGVYFLHYNEPDSKYSTKQFLSRGISSITNNHINFIITDTNNIWIGTNQGLNKLEKKQIHTARPNFHHLYINYRFTASTIINNIVWFGTEKNGLIANFIKEEKFISMPPVLDVIKNSE